MKKLNVTLIAGILLMVLPLVSMAPWLFFDNPWWVPADGDYDRSAILSIIHMVPMVSGFAMVVFRD